VKHGRARWLAAAIVLFLVGSVVTIFSSHQVARGDARSSRELAAITSSDIVSKLKLAIQHEQDLVVTTSAFFVRFPQSDQSQFRLWMASSRAFARYPELTGVAEVVIVPYAQLRSFEANALSDPAGSLGPNGTFGLAPPGHRTYYCLAKVELTRAGQVKEPAGLDFCDSPLGPLFVAARDTGRGAYFPYGAGAGEEFVVGTPVYSTGVAPTTVRARRASFVGWTGTLVVPHVLLTTALAGHAHTAVRFTYGTGTSAVSFLAGHASRGATSISVDLHNGWRVQTLSALNDGAILTNGNALALLLSGLALSLLLGALFYVLGTSRTRALELVDLRTNELEHLALHDPLTGLPNRALILDRISQMNARARRDHSNVALLFLDLDNFKEINDTLGHHAGDHLLVEVGARLSKILREGDTVGRLGGDEFVILAEGASLSPGAGALAERILDVLRAPFQIPGNDLPLTVTASIGVAEGMRAVPEDLLRDADIAMYQAKGIGKKRAVVFLPSMQEALADERSLKIDLENALENGEYFLVYQPIVHLASGEVSGVEALLLWRHPIRGVMQPDDFIPALESSGLIVPVGRWVLHEACRQGAAWTTEGRDLSVSVNLSAKQLDRDRILDDVKSAVRVSGFDPQRLVLELTETALMIDVDATVKRLRALKGLGVRLAIDDFGTGYSSLSYLSQFPIDVLKIDRSFISGVADTPEAATLVHTLVQLGSSLGIVTIAEGIETKEQLRKLVAENTDSGQGFYFSRPIDARQLARLLDNWTAHALTPTPSR
jgi:diguanylate cyclase (GGDEF)-like protein